MAQTFYPQALYTQGTTLTVGQLIERLQAMDPAKPVIFKSPSFGAFGSDTTYTIEQVTELHLPYREEHIPEHHRFDEETGEEWLDPPYTDVFKEFDGVVIG